MVLDGSTNPCNSVISWTLLAVVGSIACGGLLEFPLPENINANPRMRMAGTVSTGMRIQRSPLLEEGLGGGEL